jgi:hypothetical protein
MPQAAEAVAPEVLILAQAVERFCGSEHRTDGPGLALDLPELSRCLNLLQLKFSEMAAAFARTPHYDACGSYSPIHWLRQNCHMTAGAAADRIAVGEHLASAPESVDAIAAGEIGFPHLALIAREAAALAESGSNKQFDETPLLDKARDYTVGRFRNFCHHQRHANDPAGYAADQAESVTARSLELNTGEGGRLWIRGVLDPEGGNIVRTALEALAHRTGKGDDRKRDRRLGDAIVELAGHGQRSQLVVTTTLETLLQRAGAPAADVEFSLPLSAASVARLACDCNVTRILLGSQSQVIDVGRSKRVINPALERALRVRDRTCRWHGCDRPASYTAAHHLQHWAQGGATDLENLVLLCHRHHWMVHEGGWQIVRTENGDYLAIPPQLDVFRHFARGPDTRAA